MTYEALVLQKTPIVTFGYIMQIFLSLGIVIALVYMTGKYLLPRLQVTPKSKFLSVVDRIGLEPQASVYAVKAAGEIYILGVSSKNITLIEKLKEGELG